MVESTQQKERTFIMIKPDGVQRGLIGTIISRFETKGFKLVAMKLAQPGKEMFEKHYADLSSKPFLNQPFFSSHGWPGGSLYSWIKS